jgi:hypothetical protein
MSVIEIFDQPTGRYTSGMGLRRFALFTFIIGLLHGGLIVASELIVFGAGINLDQPLEPSRPHEILGILLNILMQPGVTLWDALRVTPESSFLEWAMLILNSLVWGVTGATMLVLSARLRRSQRWRTIVDRGVRTL